MERFSQIRLVFYFDPYSMQPLLLLNFNMFNVIVKYAGLGAQYVWSRDAYNAKRTIVTRIILYTVAFGLIMVSGFKIMENRRPKVSDLEVQCVWVWIYYAAGNWFDFE